MAMDQSGPGSAAASSESPCRHGRGCLLRWILRCPFGRSTCSLSGSDPPSSAGHFGCEVPDHVEDAQAHQPEKEGRAHVPVHQGVDEGAGGDHEQDDQDEEEDFLSSRTLRTTLASSLLRMGLWTNSRIPRSAAFSGEILSLNPVQRMTGTSGRMRMSSCASRSPVMWGIAMSEITRSYP